MKSFTIVQNLLTALAIPFLAAIVGLASIPGIYIFYGILEFTGQQNIMIDSSSTDLSTIGLEKVAITGMAAGMGIMTWGISLVIGCGILGGLFRPRLEAGRYPLQSFVTIQWAWSMIFHRIALFFLPFLVPSFLGNTYYWLSGAKLGQGVQINSAHLNDAGSVTLGDRVVIGGKAIINPIIPVSTTNEDTVNKGSKPLAQVEPSAEDSIEPLVTFNVFPITKGVSFQGFSLPLFAVM